MEARALQTAWVSRMLSSIPGMGELDALQHPDSAPGMFPLRMERSIPPSSCSTAVSQSLPGSGLPLAWPVAQSQCQKPIAKASPAFRWVVAACGAPVPLVLQHHTLRWDAGGSQRGVHLSGLHPTGALEQDWAPRWLGWRQRGGL